MFNLKPHHVKSIRIYRFNNSGINPRLCIYCPTPEFAYSIVDRDLGLGHRQLDWCCDKCAEGWLEIGDRTNKLVV